MEDLVALLPATSHIAETDDQGTRDKEIESEIWK